MIALTIPGLKLVSEANARGMWRAGHSRSSKQREVVGALLAAHKPPPAPAIIRITRHAPGTLDDDNLARACKAVRDAVAAWLGVDDGSPELSWQYSQEKSKPKVYAVSITVRAWTLATEGARVRAEGAATAVDVTLNAEHLDSLARALASQSQRPGAKPVKIAVGDVVVRVHRVEGA